MGRRGPGCIHETNIHGHDGGTGTAWDSCSSLNRHRLCMILPSPDHPRAFLGFKRMVQPVVEWSICLTALHLGYTRMRAIEPTDSVSMGLAGFSLSDVEASNNHPCCACYDIYSKQPNPDILCTKSAPTTGFWKMHRAMQKHLGQVNAHRSIFQESCLSTCLFI